MRLWPNNNLVLRAGNNMKEILKKNQFLSPTYCSWYSDILNQKIREGELPDKIAVRLTKGVHPHYVLVGPAGVSVGNYSGEMTFANDIRNGRGHSETVVSNSVRLLKFIETISTSFFSDFHVQLPPVTTTRLFLDIGTQPRLLFVPGGEAYVVVEINSPSEYLDNYYLVKEMLASGHDNSGVGVVDEICFVSSAGRNFFISRFMGFDFETEITDRNNLDLKKPLCLLTKQVDELSTKNGFLLRNLGPRNLIHGLNNATYMVDFDHVYEIGKSRKEDLYTHELSRKLWFGDLLEPGEIDTLFTSINSKERTGWSMADAFEQKLFGKAEISLGEKEEAYRMIRLFESKDFYHGIEIYGHQLGRFISDFWGDDSEVELYKLLHANPEIVRGLRFILYLLSRIDQELLLRQKYGMDLEKKLLSTLFFSEVSGNYKEPDHKALLKIFESSKSFGARYQEINILLANEAI